MTSPTRTSASRGERCLVQASWDSAYGDDPGAKTRLTLCATLTSQSLGGELHHELRWPGHWCIGLAASTLTHGRHGWFLPAIRKTSISSSEEPAAPIRFGSLAVLQAASRSDLLSAETAHAYVHVLTGPLLAIAQSRNPPRQTRAFPPSPDQQYERDCRFGLQAVVSIEFVGLSNAAASERHQPR